MSTETATSLRITRVVKAKRETVFKAWTEPDQLMRWSCPEGATMEDAAVDLKVGGRYRIRMRGENGETHTAFGVYREIDRPGRLVYTWDWEESSHAMGETLVTVEFNEVGGATEVVLKHDLFPAPEARDGHEQGWASCLNRLEKLFA